MKKYFIFLLLPLLAFIAWDDDDDDRYISIATVENPDNSSKFILKLDNDRSLWVSETNYSGYKPKTGQRVLADYTLLNNRGEGNNYDYDVKLNDAYNILTKGIFYITPETQDSIGNDPIGLRDMWIGSDFLNIRFFYDGFNQTHFISLVKDDSKTYEDNKVHLELRHNNHDDSPVYRASGIVSFNLTSLLTVPLDTEPIGLVIHVKRYDGSDRTYDMTYDPKNRNEMSLDADAFNEGKGSTVE